MKDPRMGKMAENLVRYSCHLEPGEKVLFETFDCPDFVLEALICAAYQAGAQPYFQAHRTKVERQWLLGASREQIEQLTAWDAERMQQMDAYISLRGNDNFLENADIPAQVDELYQSIYFRKVHHEIRVAKTKWCVLRYPSPSMAQLSGMSTEAFEDFYFSVCNLDYAKMSRAMDALKERMDRTDRVRIVGPGTDLSFSIRGIGAVKCAGHKNIPDGEVYTAPVRDSANGVITFNTPSRYSGATFEHIRLTLKDGRIIQNTSSQLERMEQILNLDEGARYIGEFAIGVNPYITKPMCETLFDEKIAGSIHFTPGAAYQDAFNGNVSAVHWDLVLIQTPQWGGGEIYFDGELIRKDGRFVPPELAGLNPENLV